MNKIKVRFHLGAGENYQKWQIKMPDGTVYYKDPLTSNLLLHNCKLVNDKAVANCIHDGENKKVCAWIECDVVEFIYENYLLFLELKEDRPIRYNPRVNPFWADKDEADIDGAEFDSILTKGRSLFVVDILKQEV